MFGSGDFIYVGSSDYLIRKYNAVTGIIQPSRTSLRLHVGFPLLVYKGHKGKVCALTEDKGILYSGSQDRSVHCGLTCFSEDCRSSFGVLELETVSSHSKDATTMRCGCCTFVWAEVESVCRLLESKCPTGC